MIKSRKETRIGQCDAICKRTVFHFKDERIGPQTKKYRRALKARKGKETYTPIQFPERNTVLADS